MVVSGVKSQKSPEELGEKATRGAAEIRLTRDNQAKPLPCARDKRGPGRAFIPILRRSTPSLWCVRHAGSSAPRVLPSSQLYAEDTTSEVNAHCHRFFLPSPSR